MTCKEYSLVCDEGGEFDVALSRYARTYPSRGGKLIALIEVVAAGSMEDTSFLRGAGQRSVLSIPTRAKMESGVPAALVVIDATDCTAEPARFVHPQGGESWDDHIRWAERFLGI